MLQLKKQRAEAELYYTIVYYITLYRTLLYTNPTRARTKDAPLSPKRPNGLQAKAAGWGASCPQNARRPNPALGGR